MGIAFTVFAIFLYALCFEFSRNFHSTLVFGVACFAAEGARGLWAFVMRLILGVAIVGPLCFVAFVGTLCISDWGSCTRGWWSRYHSGVIAFTHQCWPDAGEIGVQRHNLGLYRSQELLSGCVSLRCVVQMNFD